MNETDIKTRSVSPPLRLSKSVEWNALRTPTTPLVSESVSDAPNGGDSHPASYSTRFSRADANESTSSNSDEDATIRQGISQASFSAEDPKSTSKTSSPSKKRAKAPAQLIPNAPRAEKEALETFEVLASNWHQYKSLGKSKVQEDAMACECQFEHGQWKVYEL